MYVTAVEYGTITGDTAPSDFDACLMLAEALIDGVTMQYYAQINIAALPAKVCAWLKQATAYQVQAIAQMGGVAGATEPQGDVAIGKFRASAYTQKFCSPSAALVPFLIAWARGAMA